MPLQSALNVTLFNRIVQPPIRAASCNGEWGKGVVLRATVGQAYRNIAYPRMGAWLQLQCARYVTQPCLDMNVLQGLVWRRTDLELDCCCLLLRAKHQPGSPGQWTGAVAGCPESCNACCCCCWPCHLPCQGAYALCCVHLLFWASPFRCRTPLARPL